MVRGRRGDLAASPIEDVLDVLWPDLTGLSG
jgi:hypothetical protein